MTSVSMIVEKRPLGIAPGFGRQLLVKRGREQRAELAQRAGVAGITVWLCVALACVMASGADATGTVVILGLLLLAPAGWALHWSSKRPIVEVAIYELGIARREPGNDAATIELPWSEICEVFESAHEHTDILGKELRGSFTFVAYDGRKIVVDSGVPGWREIGRVASGMAQDVMSVAYELGFVAQRPLKFGDLTVDGYGVHTTEGVFPWAAVSFVRLERRGHEASFCVHVGAWSVAARVPSERIANARALVVILERLGKLDVPATAALTELSNVVEAA